MIIMNIPFGGPTLQLTKLCRVGALALILASTSQAAFAGEWEWACQCVKGNENNLSNIKIDEEYLSCGNNSVDIDADKIEITRNHAKLRLAGDIQMQNSGNEGVAGKDSSEIRGITDFNNSTEEVDFIANKKDYQEIDMAVLNYTSTDDMTRAYNYTSGKLELYSDADGTKRYYIAALWLQSSDENDEPENNRTAAAVCMSPGVN